MSVNYVRVTVNRFDIVEMVGISLKSISTFIGITRYFVHEKVFLSPT